MKILIVEEALELMENGQASLEAVGYRVSTAQSEDLAIEMMGLTNFDLTLLNINSLKVIEYINARELDTKIIVLSDDDSVESNMVSSLPVYDVLKRSTDFDVLHSSIKNALKNKELENNFTSLRNQLERSEKLHRFMIESSPDMIFIVDKEGYFAFANDRAEALLGFKKDELLGEHFASIVEPEYLDQAKHCFHERRESSRAKKDAKLWLTCREDMFSKGNKIAVELSSMGVYENEETIEGENRNNEFSGTYVVARDVTERLEAEQLIHYQAYHDLLTGLPNRALFLDRLESSIRNSFSSEDGLAVMFFDLDRFKVINDSLGHSLGDELLKQLGQRLQAALREGDTLARFGGDEFIVLLPKINSDDIALKIGEKIIQDIKRPFTIEGHEIFVTASIGISMFPRDGQNAETLIKNSDVAMYHTKESGKNALNFYKNDMSNKHSRLLNLENDIRNGMKNNQFELFYQPQMNTHTNKVIGVEALLRWNHPEKGLLEPSFFLSVAEETGLIVELGDWVLHTGLAEIKIWLDTGVAIDKLAINFSGQQIEQIDFVDKVFNALKKYGLAADLLEIEITESILMTDIESTVAKLRQLHDVGVTVAIDDFGTGYSSLSMLQKLPIDRLKIDKSFIHEMSKSSDRSIIEAIAHIARGLKLEMVAEGVEENYQLVYLKQLKCPIIQGFLFSKGVPGEQAKEFIKRVNQNEASLKSELKSEDKREKQQSA